MHQVVVQHRELVKCLQVNEVTQDAQTHTHTGHTYTHAHRTCRHTPTQLQLPNFDKKKKDMGWFWDSGRQRQADLCEFRASLMQLASLRKPGLNIRETLSQKEKQNIPLKTHTLEKRQSLQQMVLGKTDQLHLEKLNQIQISHCAQKSIQNKLTILM